MSEQFGERIGSLRTATERALARGRERLAGGASPPPDAGVDVEAVTQELQAVGGGADDAPARNDLYGTLTSAWRDPARRKWLVLGGVALLVLLGLVFLVPSLRRAGAPEAPVRQMFIAALPLLLGLFWLLSAWLVDAEARRAFVVQEPWGERRTVAYTTLAVGCVFPLILAGLLFAAWGFVTFVLDVARRQSWVAGIQAGAIILMVCAGFLLLRSALANWLEDRRSQ